ncbi:MAG TPA: sulfatase-like hydrolase/transferase [Polyangiaceae bacterium]
MLRRLLIASEGGLVGAALVAIAFGLDGGKVAGSALADFAVLAPLAIAISLAVAAVHLYFEPGTPRTPAEILAAVRAEPVLSRSRTAAAAPLGVLAAFAGTVALAHAARMTLANGAAAGVGLELAGASAAIFFLGALVVLALVPPLRRALAAGADRMPRLVDPIFTGGAALVVAALLLVVGVRTGDAGGDGSTSLAIFGVLARSELDLRPVLDLLAIAACAYLFPVALAPRRGRALRGALVALAVVAVSLGLTVHEARALNARPAVTRALERAPLGNVSLALLRRATDRDHDGFSPYFGGGDCDDHDPRRNPQAFDVPGNGIDEDCSGSDAPAPPPPLPPPAPPKVALPSDLNLIVITIDTLRLDCGFCGYPKPTTPNLDALAQKGVVFDRAYSLASYTGKSIGPLFIGKYPSETDRDGGHFNKYSAKNVFVAERLHDAGIRTFGGASHWYFNLWSGLAQGMDTWDLSAKPNEGQGENDTSITSDKLSDAALRLLADPKNTSGRFFAWFHYFDPHEQYMPHEGAPDFLGDARGGAAAFRALYDGEVWFTDKHIGRVLDYVASQDWGKRTAIIVTADHGEAFGEHDMDWHGMELWEVLVRVPLLIYVPGAEPHHVAQKRSAIDLVPTILDLFGQPQPGPDEISGRSMIDDILGKPPYEERDVYIDMPVGPYTGMRKAIITGETPGMKLIYAGGKNYQLYDLASDPDEKNDLSSDESKLTPVVTAFETMRSRMKEIDVKPDAP